jgi:uncharacterized LabA/DUF88 family protein
MPNTFPNQTEIKAPSPKRLVSFFDGQNLYHNARRLFNHYWPNFHPLKLTRLVAELEPDRIVRQVRLYTGVYKIEQNEFWYYFWTSKLQALKEKGAYIYEGKINFDGQEKGVDVKLAIDLVQLAYEDFYDVAVIFSLDTDLIEAFKLVQKICGEKGKWISLESAYPFDPAKGGRGLAHTKWRPIIKSEYEKCLDKRDYRAKHLIKSPRNS